MNATQKNGHIAVPPKEARRLNARSNRYRSRGDGKRDACSHGVPQVLRFAASVKARCESGSVRHLHADYEAFVILY